MPGVSLKPFDLLANAVRAKEIAVVLVRYGFAEIIEQIVNTTQMVSRAIESAIVPIYSGNVEEMMGVLVGQDKSQFH